MSQAWRELQANEMALHVKEVAGWNRRAEQMSSQQRVLVGEGLWRGGPRTLLAAINVQYAELVMTAGLAWMLRPDGHHGLGPAMLRRWLTHLGVDVGEDCADVRIVLEEQRDRTRADLVVYGSTWTVVVEAKTFAVEQDDQLFRLYEGWRDEPDPTFVFLTRGRRTAESAGVHSEHWDALTWQQVSEIAREACGEVAHVAPGVHEYINTLEAYHHV